MRWTIPDINEALIVEFQKIFSCSSILARLLIYRNIPPDQAHSFFNPKLRDHLCDPFLLNDMQVCVDRVVKAIQNNEPIVAYGDYDVDGATSTALLRRYFRSIGYPIGLYIPDRIEEGYGANEKALQHLFEQGTRLVLMTDCGTTAFAPLEHAKNIGLDVIVLDHHLSESTIPPSVGIINPNRRDQNFVGFSNLCAAGVTFLFLVALSKKLRTLQIQHLDLKELLDLVALGTVCDVMPLIGLNRAFVRQGLFVINQKRNLGLKLLGQVANLDEDISAYHLGFILGPRINAGGRVGKSNLGSQLLYTDNEKEATEIALKLNAYNSERQAIEKWVLERAIESVDPVAPSIIVGDQGWHPGVIGIVAGRLKDRFHKPTFVVGFEGDIGKGSARSVPGVHLGELMQKAVLEGLLLKGGGHAMAAGFSVLKENFKAFSQFLNDALRDQTYTPSRIADGGELNYITKDLMHEIDCLAPYGMGNPAPRFIIRNLQIQSSTAFGQSNLRLKAIDKDGRTITLVAFQANESVLLSSCPIDVIGSFKHNSYSKEIDLIIEDCKISDSL